MNVENELSVSPLADSMSIEDILADAAGVYEENASDIFTAFNLSAFAINQVAWFKCEQFTYEE